MIELIVYCIILIIGDCRQFELLFNGTDVADRVLSLSGGGGLEDEGVVFVGTFVLFDDDVVIADIEGV